MTHEQEQMLKGVRGNTFDTVVRLNDISKFVMLMAFCFVAADFLLFLILLRVW
jgi:hypothetical protein